MAKNEERDMREEEGADHADMRVYELGFHLDPELSETDAKAAYQAIRGEIASAGSVVAEGEPQKIQLAYTVSRTEQGRRRDFDASWFSWVAYETDGAGHEKIAEVARADKRIFRFLDIRTDKEAAKHSAEMHELMAKASEPQEGEEVSDTELDNALKEVGV
jgi:ribosomal protein S6